MPMDMDGPKLMLNENDEVMVDMDQMSSMDGTMGENPNVEQIQPKTGVKIGGMMTRRVIRGGRRTGPTTSNCGPPTKKTQGRITNYLVKISCTRNATNANGKRSLDVDMESDVMRENDGNVDVVPEPDAKKMNF